VSESRQGADGEHSYVGRSIRRREDLPLVTGEGRYAADVHFPDLLHAAFCRSTTPHGVLKSVDLDAARQMPGVVAAFAANDVPEFLGAMADASFPDMDLVGRPILARDRVRYVGEPVGVIVAEDAYQAADAAAAAVIDTAPLDATPDVLSALNPRAPALHPPIEGNLAGKLVREFGDVDAAFATAPLVVRSRFRLARVSGGYLEPRACCAAWDPDSDRWEIWTSTQWVHGVRDRVAQLLGVDSKAVRVRAENVGGGFGPKGAIYPEEVVVAALARRLRRPVRWVANRSEDTASSMQAHGDVLEVEAAIDKAGRLLGLKAHLLHDLGAYAAPGAAVVVTITNHLLSAYRVPAYRANIDLVYTNAGPTGFIRGGGREVGNFAIERTMDRIAERIGVDGVEIRRRNIVGVDQMPYATGLPGVVYDGGDYAALLDRVASAVDGERRSSPPGGGPQVGIGFALSVERTGIGTGEEARLTVEADGAATARLGSTPGGQGHETTFAQVVATSLGWPIDKVHVVAGDSDALPHSAVTAASRSAFEVGNAAAMAARAARKRLIDMGADRLEADAADVVLSIAGVHVKGTPGRSVALDELLRGGPLEVSETFKRPPAYASACHAAVVEVDPELGSVSIKRYVIAHDSGRSINPLLVEGQLHGGFAHGLGYAFLEEAVYQADGSFVSGTFLDYLIPSAPEVAVVPEMIKVTSEAFDNPEGFKGVGESATIPAPAAIAAAIDDAVRKAGGTASMNELPMTPMRVMAALRGPGPDSQAASEAAR
jgi:carbon-monoxide dehydrogenase large subunit